MRATTIALGAAAILAGAAAGPAFAQQPACAKLATLTVPASAIGEPTTGAVIKGAKLVAAAARNGNNPDRPEYCEVTGEIMPVDPAAPPIKFQVNLPTKWNSKALQMGGAGFDGFVVTGLGPPSRSPLATPVPLMRGYATFGGDSGHTGGDASFSTNAEALANYTGLHVKKTHDVALAVIRARYGKAPARTYFIGQSTGGREALVGAQRYPNDYDGVVATSPAIHFASIMFRFNDVSTAVGRPGGYLPPKKIAAFAAAAMAQCDMNDGVADGIVGNYLGCEVDRAALRCPRGANTGDTCLSDAQLATLAAIYGPSVWHDAQGREIGRHARYLVGGGEERPGGMPAWAVGRAAPPRLQPAQMDQQQLGVATSTIYGSTAIRYWVVKDPAYNTYDFDPSQYAQAFVAAQKMIAVDNPDLSAFKARGGKLIMLHNTGDLAASPVTTMDYFDAIQRTMGGTAIRDFARLYIVPGGDHGGNGAPTRADLLGMLDTWVTTGKPPGDHDVATEDGPDLKPIRAKPLCAYPYYPHYRGTGDTKDAESYRCVVARP